MAPIFSQPRKFSGRGRPSGLAFALLGAAAVQLSRTSLSFTGLLGRAPPTVACQHQNLNRIVLTARGGARGGDDEAAVGDRVKAMSPDDDSWYPGELTKKNDDGTFVVKWDDPDGGPETANVGNDNIKLIVVFKDYVVGDEVKAESPDDNSLYDGVIDKVNADGTFTVKWDDPDGGPESHSVKPHLIKKLNIFKDYKVKDVVEAVFPEDGGMYLAAVTKVNGDGTFSVKWDDPDGGPEESVVKAKDMKYPPIPFDKLVVGDKYKGTVKTIMDFGAFVDIGAEGDGLLHISRIANERVEDVNDYVEEDQEIDVWISGTRDDGKFGLTMIEGKVDSAGGGRREPADLGPFQDLSPDDYQEGKVARIAPFGAFVTVTLPGGAQADGLVHISQIRDGFVDDVNDELEEGQDVKVRVQSVDMDSGKMSLSMKEGFGGGGGGGAPRAPADLTPFEGMESKWLKGTVARTAPFGIFVTVKKETGETADGLVHITQIRDGFVESAEDEVDVGQEVDVWIQSVDTFAGKMSLSMKKAEGGDEE